MRAKRSFIDWRRPALEAVVDDVCHRYSVDGLVDLTNVVVVSPGRRAGRRFLELLAEKTEGRNFAPQLATPGDLPERLYEPKWPFADTLTQHFAWVEALRGLPDSQIRRVIGEPPPDGDISGWLALGELIANVHRELAADRRSFKDVASLPLIRDASEAGRWQALAAAQDRYLAALDALNLWDKQTARLVAIQQHEPRTECDLLLVGLVDINSTLRAML
jgi:ATP-dependent helicase/nuclease subunit B